MNPRNITQGIVIIREIVDLVLHIRDNVRARRARRRAKRKAAKS